MHFVIRLFLAAAFVIVSGAARPSRHPSATTTNTSSATRSSLLGPDSGLTGAAKDWCPARRGRHQASGAAVDRLDVWRPAARTVGRGRAGACGKRLDRGAGGPVSRAHDRVFAASPAEGLCDRRNCQTLRRQPGLKHGIKLHFGNSDVAARPAGAPETPGRGVRRGEPRSMAILVHMRASIRNKRRMGRQAQAFLDKVLPRRPTCRCRWRAWPVRAWLRGSAGAGSAGRPGCGDGTSRSPTRNLSFDVASTSQNDISPRTPRCWSGACARSAWHGCCTGRIRRRGQPAAARGLGGVPQAAAHGRRVQTGGGECGAVFPVATWQNQPRRRRSTIPARPAPSRASEAGSGTSPRGGRRRRDDDGLVGHEYPVAQAAGIADPVIADGAVAADQVVDVGGAEDELAGVAGIPEEVGVEAGVELLVLRHAELEQEVTGLGRCILQHPETGCTVLDDGRAVVAQHVANVVVIARSALRTRPAPPGRPHS